MDSSKIIVSIFMGESIGMKKVKKVWSIQAEKKRYRGSYMSAHVLLILLNELWKRDKMQGLSSILSLLRKKFNKFNNVRARMLRFYLPHVIKITLKSHFWRKK